MEVKAFFPKRVQNFAGYTGVCATTCAGAPYLMTEIDRKKSRQACYLLSSVSHKKPWISPAG